MKPDNIIRSSLPSIEYPKCTLGEYYANALTRANPKTVALINPKSGATLSYGQLHARAGQFASGLVALGVTPADTVLFFADNCLPSVVAVYGTAYLGGVTFTQAKPANGAFEVAGQLLDSGATVIVFGASQEAVVQKMLSRDEYAQAVGQLKICVQLKDNNDNDSCLTFDKQLKDTSKVILRSYEEVLSLRQSAHPLPIPYFPVPKLESSPAIIVYTSGTSGQPKGAIHSHRSFVATLVNIQLPEHFRDCKLVMQYPLGHISGTLFLQQAFDAAMTVVLFADSALEPILEAINRFRVEVSFFTADVASQLANPEHSSSLTYDLSCLRAFRYSGCKVAEHLLLAIKAKYNVEMWNLYGSTEMVGGVLPVDRDQAGEHFLPGSLGVILPNVEVKIVGLETGEALPSGEQGEICFRGAPLFIGYLNNEEATRAAIDEDGWYRSGDVGYFDATRGGCLFAADRLKELVKFRIWSIVPAEVEHFLLQHAAIREVVVVGIPHQTDGNWLRAYVQREQGSTKITEAKVIDYVKDNMGYQKRLRAGVCFVESMPRTAIGKIDRAYFRKLAQQELLKINS